MSHSPALPACRPARRWAFPPLLPPLHLGWAPPGAAAAAAVVSAAATASAGRAAPWAALPVPLATRDAAATADAAASTAAGREAAFRAAAPPGYVTNYYRRVVGRGEEVRLRAGWGGGRTGGLSVAVPRGEQVGRVQGGSGVGTRLGVGVWAGSISLPPLG